MPRPGQKLFTAISAFFIVAMSPMSTLAQDASGETATPAAEPAAESTANVKVTATAETPEAEPAPAEEEAPPADEDTEIKAEMEAEVAAGPAGPVAPDAAEDETEAPAEAPADGPQPPLPLKLTGSFFTRYELRRGQDDIRVPGPRVGQMDAVAYRARLGLSHTPVPITDCMAARLQLTPQAGGFWEAGGVNDAELGLHEGYMELGSCGFRIDAGRMEMAYGEHLVIGTVGWNQIGRSFDGARLHIGGEDSAWVDVIFTQAAEGWSEFEPSVGAGDKYFTGVYAGLGPWLGTDPGDIELDLYALVHILPGTLIPESAPDADDGGKGEAAADVTLGTRVKTRLSIVDLRAEGGIQAGSRRPSPDLPGEAMDVLAFQIDGEAGVNLLDDDLRLAAGGLFASGDDPDTEDKIEAWDQLYPTGHKFLGLSDIMGGRSNVAGPVLRARYRSPWDLTLSIDGHFFFRPMGRIVENPDGSTAVIESGRAGEEIDTRLVYAIGKGLNLGAMYAVFLPDKDWFGGDEAAHYFEVELRYTLK